MHCKSCNKPIRFNDTPLTNQKYHNACNRSKMDTTDYIDVKMNLQTYPVKYLAPTSDETRDDYICNLYSVLGSAKATVWMQENIYENINMETIYHQIMEGEIEL